MSSRNDRRRLLSPWLAMACVACSLSFASRASAFCRSRTEPASVQGTCGTVGAQLAWQGVCAGYSHFVTVPDEAGVTLDQVRAEAVTAAARWHSVPCDAAMTPPYYELRALTADRTSDTFVLSGYDARAPNANTVSFNTIWTLNGNHHLGTIAVTIVTFDRVSGEILDADVELNQFSDVNPDGFRFTVGMPQPNSADLPTILTHEFGHFLGMAHSDQSTAVMWPEAGLGETRRDLRQDDRDAICDAYPPDRTPQLTCNLVPFGGFALTQQGARVVGGCAVSPSQPTNPRRGGAFAISLIALSVASGFGRMRWRVRKPV